MPHARHARRRHVAEAAVATVAVALVGGVYLSFAHYGFDVLEEGYFLTNAWRVTLGDVPYRDFNTPYTPGVFYLYAWLMERFGQNVVLLRELQVGARFVFCLALYAAGRNVCSPFYAAIAPALILAIDTVPGIWSLHPGWFTAPFSILALACVTAYLRGGRLWWLLAAGVASGVAFAFKQNLAAYGMMAALWLVVVFERRLPLPAAAPAFSFGRRVGSWPIRLLFRVLRAGVQAAALVLLVVVPAMIALPYMSPLVAGLYLAPLVALSLVGLASIVEGTGRGSPAYGREVAFYVRPALLLSGFLPVTAAWFLPFFEVLGRRVELLGPIVGQIEQTGYYLGMLPPDGSHVRVLVVALLPAALIPLVARLGLWGRWGAALAVGTGAVVTLFASMQSRRWGDPWNAVDWLIDLRGVAQRVGTVAGEGAYSTGELLLYLPSLAFWAGLLLAVRQRRWRGASESGGLVPVWFLAAGACLLFNQYPRMDSVHLLWSGGVLFIVGAAVLERWERLAVSVAPGVAASGSARVALRLALLVLPVIATLPTVFARVEYAGQFFRPAAKTEELTRREGPYGLLRLEAPGDVGRVWLPGKAALDYREIVEMLQLKTAPDEPIFTYPAIPGFYYLAGRRNPTPFNHLFPGMATDAEQQKIVRQLEPVNYIVWDDAGAHLWVWPGIYAPVTEYIRTNYRIERFVGQYAVLSRQAVLDWGEPLYYWLPGEEP